MMPDNQGLTASNEDFTRPSSTAVTWNLTECQKDEKVCVLASCLVNTELQMEVFLKNIVVQNIKIKEFNHRSFKMKLLETLKSFHKQFQSDMTEYYEAFRADDKGEKTLQNTEGK